jgi:putative spermidine/putrescine transport system substrate-binding protein
VRRTNTEGFGGIRLATIVTAAIVVLTACNSTSAPGPSAKQPPTATLKPPTTVGTGEGQLNLIATPGYVDSSWTSAFTAATGCKVNPKYDQSTAEMVADMKDGGGGQWDMVSAPGDISLGLVYSGDVKPMNPNLIPDFVNFRQYFQAPPYNTINKIHYGIALQWWPNTLLYSTRKFPTAPNSWSTIYDASLKGLITVPDNPIQIADAAVYLMKSQPSLGIKDPYELTSTQFDAAVALLKQQRPLINVYWSIPQDEINLFQSGAVVAGTASPYETIQLKTVGAAVADTVPSEGATGFGDSWMLATRAPDPNCAYLWTKYVSTPMVQAEQALFFGEAPVNTKACAEMEALQAGSCSQYHVNAPDSYFNAIEFWKTPIATCDDGTQNCVPFSQWQTSWSTIIT